MHRPQPLRPLVSLVAAFAVVSSAPGQTLLFDLHGKKGPAKLGWNVVAVGDWDGDGYDDLALGIPKSDAGRGRVKVVSGKDRSVLAVFKGENGGDNLGSTLAAIGDVDGDGRIDLAAGGLGGYVRVYAGGTGQILYTKRVQAIGFGRHVAAVGDVDGDGLADFAVGGFDIRLGYACPEGTVWILRGTDGKVLYDLKRLKGERLAGGGVVGMGDVDGDGRADFAVGSDWAGNQTGLVTVHSGVDGGRLMRVDGPTGFGTSLASAGDLDGDGVCDLIVVQEALSWGDPVRRAVAISGFDGRELYEVPLAEDSYTGRAIAAGVDIDGDGVGDFAVGAVRDYRAGNGKEEGSVSVYSGRNGALLFRHYGDNWKSNMGWSLAFVGDVDGDGAPDLAFGTPNHGHEGDEVGLIRVFSTGCPGTALPICSGEPNSVSQDGAVLEYTGSTSQQANDLRLTLSDAPPEVLIRLLWGTSQRTYPFGDGFMCISSLTKVLGPLGRTTSLGTWTHRVDLASPDNPFAPAEAPIFQVWYRDPAGGPEGSNLSSAIRLTICH